MMEARSAGLKLAIASTTSPENVESLLTSSFGSDATSWFAAIATGDVVAKKKPAPDIYEYVLRQLDAAPAACAAIEDSANGLRAAKAAGLFTMMLWAYPGMLRRPEAPPVRSPRLMMTTRTISPTPRVTMAR